MWEKELFAIIWAIKYFRPLSSYAPVRCQIRQQAINAITHQFCNEIVHFSNKSRNTLDPFHLRIQLHCSTSTWQNQRCR